MWRRFVRELLAAYTNGRVTTGRHALNDLLSFESRFRQSAFAECISGAVQTQGRQSAV